MTSICGLNSLASHTFQNCASLTSPATRHCCMSHSGSPRPKLTPPLALCTANNKSPLVLQLCNALLIITPTCRALGPAIACAAQRVSHALCRDCRVHTLHKESMSSSADMLCSSAHSSQPTKLPQYMRTDYGSLPKPCVTPTGRHAGAYCTVCKQQQPYLPAAASQPLLLLAA